MEKTGKLFLFLMKSLFFHIIKIKTNFLAYKNCLFLRLIICFFQVGPGKIISPTFFDIKYGKFVHLCAEISAQTDMSTVILSLGEQGFVVNTILW